MPLTFKKRRFVAGLMAGMTDHEAAREAGYSAKGLKVTVFRLRRCPHVQTHLARARQWAHLPPRPATDDPLKYLLTVMADPREPPVLRLEAAIAAAPYLHGRLPPKRPPSR